MLPGERRVWILGAHSPTRALTRMLPGEDAGGKLVQQWLWSAHPSRVNLHLQRVLVPVTGAR